MKEGKATGKVLYLRADEEMKAVLAPCDALEEGGKLRKGMILARVDGELAEVDSAKVDYLDISPKQIVGISAALIPFLEHDDANRALMGSNMQRQAVPLIKVDPPCIATGIEKPVGHNSGMVVRAKNAGTVTFVDGQRIIIDNADEYVLRKFVGLNERTCLNQRPIVKPGQKVEKNQVIADGASTKQGELAIGKNVLVAFNTFDGYNFEDAIVINEKLVRTTSSPASTSTRSTSRSARPSWGARSSRATSPTSPRRCSGTSTSTASSASAPAWARATSWSAR